MRILMLGNSLTSANDLPQTLSRLAGAQVVAHTRGGARLAEQLNPDTRLGASTQQALRNERWDFVVLQESSNGPIVHRESFLRACEGLCAYVRTAGAEPVLFATWAYRADNPGLAHMGLSREEMAAALTGAYREAAQAGGALLADVGSRFLAHPDPDALYAPDGLHPSAAGSLLAAQTLAEAIRAASVQGRPATPER